MKKAIARLGVFTLLTCLYPVLTYSQSTPPDSNLHYHDDPPNVVTVFSFEDTSWNESIEIPVWIKAEHLVDFRGYIKIIDNPWLEINGSDSIAYDTLLNENDSFSIDCDFNYDTTNLPFYPKEITIQFYPDSTVVDSLKPEKFNFKVLVYFTSYRSVEIWNSFDFGSLK